MPISITLTVPIFLTIWFVVLFALLPIGVRSQRESGAYMEGTDPGAPANPRLLKKAGLTTLVSLALFAALMIGMRLCGWPAV
jgi:predicted secreted protein